MPNDHYVAQTYLRHFAGPSGMLRAYRKSDGATFPCWPRDICREPNGDMIPDFLSEPGYLGDYRTEFERVWNCGVAALKSHRLDMCDKLHLAGYWAQLLVCTPAWTRIGVDISNHNAINTLSAFNTISAEKGNSNEKLNAAIKDVEDGKILVQTEADYARAQAARSVLKFAWELYNADWDVLENNTDIEYLTSDNPASFEDQGDTWILNRRVRFLRFLPVTPRLCLMCDLTRNYGLIINEKQDFTKEPKGTIRGGFIGLETVQRINTCTAKCAEDLVLSSVESVYARDLTALYSSFHIETESKRFREATGFLIGNRTRCVERKDRKAVQE